MGLNTILLVDDSEPFNYLSRAVLADNKITCTVHEALNGQEALDYLEREETCPDVILLDLNMPVMDGFDFLEEYATRNKCHDKTKVFVLTSSNRAEDKERAVKNKYVLGYFDKPLSYFHIKEIQTFFEE